MAKATIQAEQLVKKFGDKVAVNHVSLQVREGEIYGLVGPDGAGKTTMIRLLCGAYRPDSGEVSVSGYSMNDQVDKAREQIGYLSQRFSLYEDLTVLENLRFFAEVRGLDPSTWKQRSLEILQFVGLDEFIDRRAGHLSGGMKQKLGLATALVHRPRVLLLDEPTGGVDPVTRQDFWQLIIQLITVDKISVLVSTPYMDEAVRCTYVGFMMNGQLIVEDNPKTLRNQLEGQLIELWGEPAKLLRDLIAPIIDIEDIQKFGDRLHIRVASGKLDEVVQKINLIVASSAQISLQELRPVSAGLEDVFIHLLQKYGDQRAR